MNYQPVIVKKVVDDEHFYYVDDKFAPSVTKVLHEAMPMPLALKMWIGDVGNERAEQKLKSAGNRGTMIHTACEMLLQGAQIELKDFPDRKDKKCLVSFINWFSAFQPVVTDIEKIVASTLGYAGTLDIMCTIDDSVLPKKTFKQYPESNKWIIDIKTSASVYMEHFLQIKAYQEAVFEMTGERCNTAILHLNPKTKAGYSFITEMKIGDKNVDVNDFMVAFNMFLMINGGVIPEPKLVDEYPETLSLLTKEDAKD